MQPSFARQDSPFDSLRAGWGRLSLQGSGHHPLDAEVRGSKGTPQALKRGYLNRLKARVELVPFPIVKRENIFTVVNAAEER
jgi:hypothetical protein